VPAASSPNASVCRTAWTTRENRPPGCNDDHAGVARDGEARRGYVPTEQIATYRELVRLHTQLSDDIARSKNEIHALLIVLFPEFTQVFADPARPTALGLLKRYPSAQAMVAAGIEAITATLHELAPRHFWFKTEQHLLQLAQQSVSSGVATSARARSLAVLCDQLEHTQTNLTQLEEEIDRLLDADKGAKGVQSVPECGCHRESCVKERERSFLNLFAMLGRCPFRVIDHDTGLFLQAESILSPCRAWLASDPQCAVPAVAARARQGRAASSPAPQQVTARATGQDRPHSSRRC
jgi:hypothetical protein